MYRGLPALALAAGALVVVILLSANLKALTMLGGKKEVDVSDTNSLEIDEVANFAVSEHNNRQVCTPLTPEQTRVCGDTIGVVAIEPDLMCAKL
jgi:hypothetical protein